MYAAVHCSLCEYFHRQHNAKCCCDGCWRERTANGSSGGNIPEQQHTQHQHQHQQPHKGSSSAGGCVHITGSHHSCKACLLPDYRYTTYSKPSGTGIATTATTTKSRSYICDGCRYTAQQEEEKTRVTPIVGCGCGASCACRCGTSGPAHRRRRRLLEAREVSRLDRPVTFAPNAVPKMGAAAGRFMNAAPPADSDRARYQY